MASDTLRVDIEFAATESAEENHAKITLVPALAFLAGIAAGQLGLELPTSLLWVLLGSGTLLWGWAAWRGQRDGAS